jgi:hypothetical protein
MCVRCLSCSSLLPSQKFPLVHPLMLAAKPKARGPVANVEDFVPDESLTDDFFDNAKIPAALQSAALLERYFYHPPF